MPCASCWCSTAGDASNPPASAAGLDHVAATTLMPSAVHAARTGAAAKTYDIGVWLPGEQAHREISSCKANTEACRARHARIRFRREVGKGKPAFVHAQRNGCRRRPRSPRASPDALSSRMRGLEVIEPRGKKGGAAARGRVGPRARWSAAVGGWGSSTKPEQDRGMAKWLKAAVLKAVGRETRSGVRIPDPPPVTLSRPRASDSERRSEERAVRRHGPVRPAAAVRDSLEAWPVPRRNATPTTPDGWNRDHTARLVAVGLKLTVAIRRATYPCAFYRKSRPQVACGTQALLRPPSGKGSKGSYLPMGMRRHD